MLQQVEVENIPDEVLAALTLGSFASSYSVNGSMNPFYLRGDFDGDHEPDYAVWIKAKRTGSVGIAVWLSSQKKLTVLGAGEPFLLGKTSVRNLNFLNVWKVFSKRPIEQGVEAGAPPKLIGDAISAGKRESASGIIYWTGKNFAWYQQGD